MKYVDVAALIASVFLHHLSIRSEPTVHRLMYQKQDEEQEEVSVPVQMPKRNSNSLSQSSYIHDSAASFSLSSSLSKKPRTHISNNHPNNFPQLASISTSVTATASPIKKRSREEIVQAAKQQGAKGG